MRINYHYHQYKNSRAATEWSLLGNMLRRLGLLIIICFFVLGGVIAGTEHIVIGGIIGLVFGILLVVFGGKFCLMMEARSLTKAVLKEKLGRTPTKEEITAAIKGPKQNNTQTVNSDSTKSVPRKQSKYPRVMTSQLVALWLDSDDAAYRDEYIRRIKKCGLSDDKAEEMLAFESDILKKHPRPEMLKNDFLSTPMFNLCKPVLEHPIDYYQDHLEYPLSYVIKLSDEAEWHFWNSHEKSQLSDEAWAEIFALCDKNRKLFLPIGMHLVEKMQWSYDNVNKFSYNEQGMLDLYRWGKSTTGASRTPWQ